jgi:hypothetical protein
MLPLTLLRTIRERTVICKNRALGSEVANCENEEEEDV